MQETILQTEPRSTREGYEKALLLLEKAAQEDPTVGGDAILPTETRSTRGGYDEALRLLKEAAQANYRLEHPHTHMRAIRLPEVRDKTGLSTTHIYELRKRGDFPQPLKLSGRVNIWRESDVDAWLEDKFAGL